MEVYPYSKWHKKRFGTGQGRSLRTERLNIRRQDHGKAMMQRQGATGLIDDDRLKR